MLFIGEEGYNICKCFMFWNFIFKENVWLRYSVFVYIFVVDCYCSVDYYGYLEVVMVIGIYFYVVYFSGWNM